MFPRLGPLLLAFALASPGLAACKRAATWTPLSAAGAGYEVLLPGAVTSNVRKKTTGHGDLDVHQWLASDGHAEYAVWHVELPDSVVSAEEPAALLTTFWQSEVEGLGAAGAAFTKVASGGHAGVEGRFDGEVQGQKGRFRVQVYLVGSRLVELVRFQRSGEPKPDADARFFGSLRFTEASPVEPSAAANDAG